MRRTYLTIVIVALLIVSGCAYRDMNRLQFVTLSIFDRNIAGKMVVYQELFSSDRGNGENLGVAKRTLSHGSGDTIGDAFYNMQGSISLPMAYDVNKAIVFTEKVAREGLEEYIGAFDRNQKPTLKQFMFICEDDPVEILNTKLEDEEYIGVFLDEMMVFQEDQSRILSIMLNEYLNNRLIGSKVAVVPIIGTCDKPTGDRLEVSGAAVLENDKMVEKLSPDEVVSYKIFTNELKVGDATVQNPQDKDKLVSLLVLSNKTKNNIEYDGENVVVNKQIKTVYSIQSAQGKFDILDDKVKKELIKRAEKDIKKRCTELFEKYQEKEIDLFNVEMQLKRKYPNIELQDVLENTTLNVDVTVTIDGTENMTNSK